jgi:signal transduction histidine kinase
LLRVVQEAVNNTVKHAAARHVCVELIYEANSVVLSITDDGKGFVPEQVRTGGLGHFGLRSLRSRVGKIRGNLEIVSSPAKGTTIRVRVPISES